MEVNLRRSCRTTGPEVSRVENSNVVNRCSSLEHFDNIHYTEIEKLLQKPPLALSAYMAHSGTNNDGVFNVEAWR